MQYEMYCVAPVVLFSKKAIAANTWEEWLTWD